MKDMDYVVKLNGKIFTIKTQKKNQNKKALCPDGTICFIAPDWKTILHRDSLGLIQSEPVVY